MLNLAAAVERAREFDIIHYEAAYYPMSLGVHAAVPDADRPDAAPLAERRGSALWSRYPEAPFVAISQGAGAPARAASTSSAPCCTGSTPITSRSSETPDDYLLFLGRFTDGKGVAAGDRDRQARRHAADSRRRRRRLLSRDGRAARRRRPRRLLRRGRLHGQGEAVRRRARAALSDPGARAVRAGARRGDGVRHAGRRARSRRGARGGGRRRHGHRFPTNSTMVDGLPRVFALDRAARPRARHRAVRRERMVDEYIAVYRRIVEARIVPGLQART